MNTQQLKKAILQEAISGRLTAQWREENGVTEEWKVVKLGEVCKIYTGNSINENVKETKYKGLSTGYDFIATKDVLQNHEVNYDNGVRIPFDEPKFNIARKGSCLMCIEGGSAGKKIGLIDRDVCFGNKLCCFDANNPITSHYVFLYLQSAVFANCFQDALSGLIGGVSRKSLGNVSISLPPIEEQREIVRRVEEMFGEIEKIEEGKEKMEVLGRMLKKRVLEEAISGRLVSNEMEPGEKTAEQLLKDILAERKKNDPKKAKVLSPIDEEPWALPEGWKWCRLGEIVKNRDSERIPLSVGTREKMLTKKYDYYGPGGAFDKVEDYIFDKRLLLIGEDGANLLTQSKPNAFFADGKYWVNNHVHVLDSYCDDIILEIIAIRINSMSLEAYVTGSAQPKLNQDKLNMIPIPLPPISIQKRIVKMINYTFEIMDKQINNNL